MSLNQRKHKMKDSLGECLDSEALVNARVSRTQGRVYSPEEGINEDKQQLKGKVEQKESSRRIGLSKSDHFLWLAAVVVEDIKAVLTIVKNDKTGSRQAQNHQNMCHKTAHPFTGRRLKDKLIAAKLKACHKGGEEKRRGGSRVFLTHCSKDLLC